MDQRSSSRSCFTSDIGTGRDDICVTARTQCPFEVIDYPRSMGWPVRHISRFIDRKPAEVCAFLADHRNLPKWASGLSSGVSKENGVIVSDSPMGKVHVRFAAGSELGVFDHDVTLPDGQTFHNPLRVLKNDDGSEVVFTLYRLAGVTDEAYEKDAATIAADLERIGTVM